LLFLSVFLSQLVQKISKSEQLVLHALKARMQPLYQLVDTLWVKGKSVYIPHYMAKA